MGKREVGKRVDQKAYKYCLGMERVAGMDGGEGITRLTPCRHRNYMFRG